MSRPLAQRLDIDINFGGQGYGQYGQRVTDVNSLFRKLYDISDALIFILISLAVVWIIWTTVRFIMQSDSVKRAEVRGQIIWGIVGLAIILSIWGLVNILGNTFGLGNYGSNNYEANRDLNGLMLQRPAGSNQPVQQPQSGSNGLVPYDPNYRE